MGHSRICVVEARLLAAPSAHSGCCLPCHCFAHGHVCATQGEGEAGSFWKKFSGDPSQQTRGLLLPKNICCDCQAIYVSEDKLCADMNIFPP